MMITLLNFITKAFDLILSPFQGLGPIYGLMVLAVITGLIMVTIFSKVSNQEKMGQVKNLIKAHFLELRIYKNDIHTTLSSQKKILRYNLSYMKLAFIPATIMFIPILFILIQLNLRYGVRPLSPGEAVVVRASLRDSDPMQVSMILPSGIKHDLPPLRIPSLQEVNWRIVPEGKGDFDLVFTYGGERVIHKLVVSDKQGRLYPSVPPADFDEVFLNPGHAKYLTADSPFRTIEIDYPSRNLGLGLVSLPDWLVIFFATSICSGLILKKVLKIH